MPGSCREGKANGSGNRPQGWSEALNGKRRLVPWWGYVVINLVALLFLFLVYLAGESYAASYRASTAGIFPVLLTCYLAFLVVSVFDAIYDRLDVRRRKGTRGRGRVRTEPSRDGERRPEQ